MDAIKTWWAQAPARDQMALVLGLSFLGLYILFMGVLKPVISMNEKEQKRNDALRGSLERVRDLAAQVQAQNHNISQGGRSRIESVVQRSVSANGLQVGSMSSAGSNGLRMRFDEAPFEDVLRWLHEMEVQQNMLIKDVSVAASSNPGRVSVNLRLQQP